VALLGPRQRLAAAGNLEVYRAEARQIPYLLLELGRLREMTFRGVDEGTGRPFDLDEFDNHYTHLFAWNRAKREVVGAYRLGRVDPGTEGFPGRLYTSTLFAYGADFLRRLGPALELGRSFVRPEYQRQFAPLLLLWKGIGAFVAENPRYRTLFGPVSITREYSRLSRELLTTALAENCLLPDLARLVHPRTPVRRRPLSAPGCDPRMLRSLGADLDAATELIAEIDPASGGMPVLLRHYLGLGGRVVAFNLDRAFSDVIDALVVVDLRQTDPRVLARYLGRRKADEFLRYHTPSASGLPACA
ncbi:MAG TPA: GNAT family N-acyltransferase, partial [Gammaproteobacteria bacterium]|nr:GNAT family N-acyltransferase [Gammaproteobacteria bacterium]